VIYKRYHRPAYHHIIVRTRTETPNQ
jgi:hypothetical protein